MEVTYFPSVCTASPLFHQAQTRTHLLYNAARKFHGFFTSCWVCV